MSFGNSLRGAILMGSKSLFASKTFWFNLAVGTLGVVAGLLESMPEGSAELLIATSVVNMLLRLITAKAVYVV
jgi:hypothetical protein